jgi:hypothetical protein
MMIGTDTAATAAAAAPAMLSKMNANGIMNGSPLLIGLIPRGSLIRGLRARIYAAKTEEGRGGQATTSGCHAEPCLLSLPRRSAPPAA